MHWRTYCHKISLAHSGPFFLIFSIGFYILFFKNHVCNKELFSNQITSNGFFLTVYLSCICYLKIKFEWKTLCLLIHISGPENKEKLVKSTQTAILSSEGECVKVQNQVYIHSIIYLHLKFWILKFSILYMYI